MRRTYWPPVQTAVSGFFIGMCGASPEPKEKRAAWLLAMAQGPISQGPRGMRRLRWIASSLSLHSGPAVETLNRHGDMILRH